MYYATPKGPPNPAPPLWRANVTEQVRWQKEWHGMMDRIRHMDSHIDNAAPHSCDGSRENKRIIDRIVSIRNGEGYLPPQGKPGEMMHRARSPDAKAQGARRMEARRIYMENELLAKRLTTVQTTREIRREIQQQDYMRSRSYVSSGIKKVVPYRAHKLPPVKRKEPIVNLMDEMEDETPEEAMTRAKTVDVLVSKKNIEKAAPKPAAKRRPVAAGPAGSAMRKPTSESADASEKLATTVKAPDAAAIMVDSVVADVMEQITDPVTVNVSEEEDPAKGLAKIETEVSRSPTSGDIRFAEAMVEEEVAVPETEPPVVEETLAEVVASEPEEAPVVEEAAPVAEEPVEEPVVEKKEEVAEEVVTEDVAAPVVAEADEAAPEVVEETAALVETILLQSRHL
ncbi:unnamed protein product [Amoebophrya sp. A25]|nr:unnamed protein product [Amoebophrya sp. A25]|eukprot:GSA25T00021147001.1